MTVGWTLRSCASAGWTCCAASGTAGSRVRTTPGRSAAPTDWTTAFSATWEGNAALPTLAFGNYVGLDAQGNATYKCPDNELYRPSPGGAGYAPSVALAPGYCALSMLFSDWDGSGRRDLRVSNDRHYYDNRVGQEQLWRIEAGQPPRLYTAARRVGRAAGLGDGDRELRRDG